VHTTLETPGGLPIEVQIRTEEMHAAAEFGTSHASSFLSCLLVLQQRLQQLQQYLSCLLVPLMPLLITDAS